LRLLFIFLDGVGLGADLPSNPFVSNSTPGLDYILEGRALSAASSGFNGQKATLLGLDAVLGVSGLPQSATGQASIFTGSNAPAYLGSHANGFPGAKLRRLLATRGIFRELKRKGFNPFFANAYRPPFFELLKRGCLENAIPALPLLFITVDSLLTLSKTLTQEKLSLWI
jgi:2,3-bisphosphoglycerate-independent phosphoglycerate mutase